MSVQVTFLWQQPLTRAYGGGANKEKKEQHKVSLLAICKCDQGVKLGYYLVKPVLSGHPCSLRKATFQLKDVATWREGVY